jgi:sugar transferase EpsL
VIDRIAGHEVQEREHEDRHAEDREGSRAQAPQDERAYRHGSTFGASRQEVNFAHREASKISNICVPPGRSLFMIDNASPTIRGLADERADLQNRPRSSETCYNSRVDSRSIKRAFDLVVAGGLLTVGAPVIAGTALAVWYDVGRPVLFRQKRGGFGGRVFEVIKFRTMRDATDRNGRALPDEERLTRIGKFLRASSLDELPQLFNVLRGEMSLVGPRPFIADYLRKYSPFQHRRHEVTPGITGWAQINGRNTIDWDAKIKLDVWYVDHWSLALDLEILLRTVAFLIQRRGISAENHATMPLFQGSTG